MGSVLASTLDPAAPEAQRSAPRSARLLLGVLTAVVAGAAGSPASAQTSVAIETDIPYTFQGGEDISLDAYLPEAEGPHPAIVWIHGGRWAAGDKSQDADLIEALASEGFAVFSVNYRLVKEAPYPAAVEDVQEAVRWVRDNAEEYDVDPERIGAIGVSAGAHLAGLLATLDEGPLSGDARISAAVSLSGPMDMVTAALEPGNLGRAVETFLECAGADCQPVAEDASPITHVDETDAPMLLVNSTEEIIPIQQATSMGAALDAVDVDNAVLLVPGAEHGIAVIGGGKPGAPDVQEAYTAFLLEHVAGVEGAFEDPDALDEPVEESPTEDESPTPDTSPIAAPPVDPPSSSSWMSWVFLLLALGTAGASAAWYMRKRRLERHPY